MKLTLNVVGGGLYGYKFDWDTSDEPWPGQTLTFNDALRGILDNIYGFYFIPSILRQWLPFSYTRKLQSSFEECGQYFRKFIALEKQGGLSVENGRSILSLL